jgi:hypothetical protein
VWWWCCEFTNVREDLNDNERLGWPRTSLTPNNIARVDATVKADWRVHLKLISKTAVQQWFRDQQTEFYNSSISKLVVRWDKCLNRSGDYVEK